MGKNTDSNKELKKAVGQAAAQLIQNDMICGLGTGSTVAFLLEELGRRIKDEHLKIHGVPTSFQSKILCSEYGIPVLETQDCSRLDIAIDGADEVDSQFNLIKGGGAAHTREKIVAAMADEFIIIVDESKLVSELGAKFPIPIEIIPSALSYVKATIEECGGCSQLRMGLRKDGPIITDNGQMVLDVTFDQIPDLKKFDIIMHQTPGVVETGLFLNMVQKVLVGTGNVVKTLTK